ncbi:tubulin gamma chain [Moniliophthora roreri]|nr:tubulin gamma chain [Moniliophthora roreri]
MLVPPTTDLRHSVMEEVVLGLMMSIVGGYGNTTRKRRVYRSIGGEILRVDQNLLCVPTLQEKAANHG